MAFLRGVKRCSKLNRIKNEVTRKELQVFNLNAKLKDYKQRWKEHSDGMSGSIPVSYTHLDVYKRQLFP